MFANYIFHKIDLNLFHFKYNLIKNYGRSNFFLVLSLGSNKFLVPGTTNSGRIFTPESLVIKVWSFMQEHSFQRSTKKVLKAPSIVLLVSYFYRFYSFKTWVEFSYYMLRQIVGWFILICKSFEACLSYKESVKYISIVKSQEKLSILFLGRV